MSYHRNTTVTIASGETYSTPLNLQATPDYSQNTNLVGIAIDAINGNQVHFQADIGDGVWRDLYNDGTELDYKIDDNQAICLNPNQFNAWKRIRIYFTQGNNPLTQDAERTIQIATRST